MLRSLPARDPLGRAFLFSALLLAGVLLAACTRTPPADARSTAQAFYDWHLREQPQGLPTPAQTKSLYPLLSRELQTALERARAEQTQFLREHPQDKPPWIEGDLFSSLFEGVQRYRIIQVDETPTEARVLVHLEYRDPGSAADAPAAADWRDRLRLLRENGRWVVADLEYGGDWGFAHRGTLLRALQPIPASPSTEPKT